MRKEIKEMRELTEENAKNEARMVGACMLGSVELNTEYNFILQDQLEEGYMTDTNIQRRIEADKKLFKLAKEKLVDGNDYNEFYFSF